MHRYPDRVLLKPVHVCAVYCRFCFRREVVGRAAARFPRAARAALDYIRAHQEIWEVILTGGDPLVLSPRRLATIMRGARRNRARQDHPRAYPRARRCAGAGHALARARAQGARQGDLCGAARQPRARARRKARAACARLVDAGIPMLSQTCCCAASTMMRNASAPSCAPWSNAAIKPYYLHHGDLAPGTAHWRTAIAEGQALMRALRGRALRAVPADLCARHSRAATASRRSDRAI